MEQKGSQKLPSVRGLVAYATLVALAAVTDAAALVLVCLDIRAHTAAFCVYAFAVALTLAAVAIFLPYRKSLARLAADKLASGRIAAALRKLGLDGDIFTDYGKRTLIASLAVLAVNIVYVAYLVWMAVAYGSDWYGALAGYYAWLVIARSGILAAERTAGKRYPSALFRPAAAVAGGLALILAAGISIASIIQMAIGAYPASVGGIAHIVINALFAVVKNTSAVVQCVRAASFRDPVTRTLRNFSLAAAFMSLLSVEISVIATFANGYSMWEYVTVLGALVCGTTFIIGAVVVIRWSVALHRCRTNALPTVSLPSQDAPGDASSAAFTAPDEDSPSR